MSFLRILLVFAGAGSMALAQTNNPVEVRRLSLQEAIQLALTNNLDLQIDRYNPQINLYNLRANYGDYDPTLNLSGQHDHRETGSQLVAGGFAVPTSVSDDNSFNATVNGLLPWGTAYTIGTLGPIIDTYGSSPGFVLDTNGPPIFRTNAVYSTFGGPQIGSTFTTNFPQFLSRSSFENSAGSVGIHVNQPLLKNFWIDQTRLNISVAKNRLKYTELALKLQIMQTLTALEQAYFDLIYDHENVIVLQKAVELAERLVAENKKRLEVGALAPLDLQSAEAQAASARAAVIKAQADLGTQERLVKALITDRYRADWFGVRLDPAGTLTAPAPVLNLQDSWSRGLEQRPDLLQAKLDIQAQGIQLKYDRNQLLPEVDAFATFGYNGSGREFSDALYDIQQMNRQFYTYGGQLSLPLTRTRTRNTYQADKAKMEQYVLTVKKLEQTIMVQIDNDIGTIRASFDAVQATRAAREYQEAALDAEQKKLNSGKSTTYNVLLVQRDLTNARGAEIQALDTYNKSLSQLSLDEGSTLERLGISFEAR